MSKQPRKCPAKESFQRMNYLYQASNFLANGECSSRKASDMYTNLVVNISKKTVQRLDIDVKRTICKGCRCLLLAGVSCNVRVKKKHVRWICLKCGTVKTFDCSDKEYLVWPQKNDSIVDILDYKLDK